MEPEKTPPEEHEAPGQPGETSLEESPQAPADALSRTPDDLAEEAAQTPQNESLAPGNIPPEKKLSPFKRVYRKVNIYLLLFLLIVIVAIAITVVNYLNSQKAPVVPAIASQQLTAETLKQLASSDVSVGSGSQTLNVQGNMIVAGQTLMRGNLSVAGNLQTGGTIQASGMTIAGNVSLGPTQTQSLQIEGSLAAQGATTLRDLNVAGVSSFGGPLTASQLTVTTLVMSGNARLQVPNHISFTGPAPSRSVTAATLGSGGSASVDGSDTSGTININTGNNPQPGCFVQVTFNQRFSAQPRVIISPVGAGAGQLSYYVTRNESGFSVCTNNAAPANQVFSFDYFVAG